LKPRYNISRAGTANGRNVDPYPPVGAIVLMSVLCLNYSITELHTTLIRHW